MLMKITIEIDNICKYLYDIYSQHYNEWTRSNII